MRKIFVGLVIFVCVAAVHAEQPTTGAAPTWIGEQSMDVLPVVNEFRALDPFADELRAMKRGYSGVTEETVGDPDSFGRKKTYLGVVQTASVHLRADCSTDPPVFPRRCIEPNPAPGLTIVDEADLGVIELPAKATNSILCFTFTPFTWWQWVNYTGSAQTAQMYLRPSVRIESKVLDDPALIDPTTGLPFDGVLLDSTITTFLQARTLQPNESDSQFRVTTRSCTGGLVNLRTLRDVYGLSDAVIKDFFKNPITVSFGVRGQVSMVEDASYSVGIRLYGD